MKTTQHTQSCVNVFFFIILLQTGQNLRQKFGATFSFQVIPLFDTRQIILKFKNQTELL